MILKKISAIEIDRILRESHNFIPSFKGCEFDDCSIFNDPKYSFTYLVFKDCVFNTRFVLRNKKIKQGLFIKGCKFNEGLYLSNVYSDERNPYFPNAGKTLFIQNTEIKKKFSVTRCRQYGVFINVDNHDYHIKIERVVCQSELAIYKTKAESLSIMFCDAYTFRVTFLECEDFHFQYNSFRVLRIQHSKFCTHSGCFFASEKREKGPTVLCFEDNVFTFSWFSLFLGKSDTYCIFRNNDFREGASIYRLLLPGQKGTFKLFMENNTTDKEVKVDSILDDRPIDKLKISFNQSSTGIFSFAGWHVKVLEISGDCLNIQLNVNGMTLTGSLIFNRLMNQSVCRVHNIKVMEGTSLIMKQSYLGTINFSNIDFGKFVTITIDNSLLTEAEFNSVGWFSPEQIEFPNTDKYSLEWSKKMYYLFRQIKRSSEKSYDKILASYFRSLEEKYYYNSLKFTHDFWSRERIMMSLKLTNDFGLNWVRPIELILLVNVIFFLLIVFSSQNFYNSVLSLDFWNSYYSSLCNSILLFPQLLNPAHSFKEFFESTGGHVRMNFVSYFLDVVQRIVLSFLIFQTIVAFRKQPG